MSVAVIGLNHTTAPLEVRERFVFSAGQAEAALAGLLEGGSAREAVLLSTCNRTELYAHLQPDTTEEAWWSAAEALLATRAGLDPATSRGYLYRRAGADAARHLFRVASSLDSMVVGEAQIQGQVREAYEAAAAASAARLVGPVLSRLFETALSVGGRVRTETTLGAGAASIPSAAVELAKKIFGSLKGHRALVLGAGEMSRLSLQCLAAEGVQIVAVANRTGERAADLAEQFGGRSAGYERLGPLLREADIVVSATSAPHYMLARATLDDAFEGGRKEPLLIVDLALPRDVEPTAGELENVFLYDMDDLRQIVDENRTRRESELPAAERIIDGAVDEFQRWYASLDVVPLIRALRDRADGLRAGELDKALRRLEHLSPEDRDVVEALAAQLTNKLMHEPTVRLREGAGNGHPTIAETARYLFDLSRETTETEGTIETE